MYTYTNTYPPIYLRNSRSGLLELLGLWELWELLELLELFGTTTRANGARELHGKGEPQPGERKKASAPPLPLGAVLAKPFWKLWEFCML